MYAVFSGEYFFPLYLSLLYINSVFIANVFIFAAIFTSVTFRPYGYSCSYFASRYHIKIFRKTIHCSPVRSHDLWKRYELNRNQITSIGLMISNKLLLATRIDNKTIIRVGYDWMEQVRKEKSWGGLEGRGTSRKRDRHRVSDRYWHTSTEEPLKISTGLLGRRTHAGGDEECWF